MNLVHLDRALREMVGLLLCGVVRLVAHAVVSRSVLHDETTESGQQTTHNQSPPLKASGRQKHMIWFPVRFTVMIDCSCAFWHYRKRNYLDSPPDTIRGRARRRPLRAGRVARPAVAVARRCVAVRCRLLLHIVPGGGRFALVASLGRCGGSWLAGGLTYSR